MTTKHTKRAKRFGSMKNISYICSAKQLERGYIHTKNTAINSVSSCVHRVTFGLFRDKIKEGALSFCTYTQKLVTQMRNNNKQATKAKNSNLYAIDIVIVSSTIVISILLLIFAPSVLMAIAKFIGVCVLVALAVLPMLHAINILKYEQ